MKLALALISHSLQMLWHNRVPLLRMTVPLLLIFEVASYLLGLLEPADEIGPATGTLIVMGFIVNAWIAVVWHRYVLLSETPAGLIPVVNARFITNYIFKAIGLGFVVGIGVVLMIAGMSLAWLPISGGRSLLDSGPGVFLVSLLILMVAGVWLAQRLGLVLTAAAVGYHMSLRESWKRTAPVSGTLWITAAIQVIASLVALMVIGLAITAMASLLGTVFGMAMTFVFSWLVLMVGVTMLTTLYGHIVEGRELVSLRYGFRGTP